MTTDSFGRVWNLPESELCPTCKQPDNCGDCNHNRLSADQAISLGAHIPKGELEEIYMDGCADEVSGDVESPTGHFYRVGSQVVVTDSQGFSDVTDYDSEVEAEWAFQELDESYRAGGSN